MGFAGPRVIEQTIRQQLPDGFQTSEFLLARGQVDSVQPRQELRGWLSRLLAVISQSAGAGERRAIPAAPVITDPGELSGIDAWQSVSCARDTARPTTLDYLAGTFGSFIELHGDRLGMDCPSVVAGLALLHGSPVGVIGHQKGHQTGDLVARNFGMPMPGGYRKARRVMELAARLGLPVVTIVDTPGAFPGPDAEAGGQAGAIAENIRAMFELRVPIVTVVTGEGGSGGALALAVADRVLMLERTTYSVISPEGCSAILWGDARSAPAAARALRITARELLDLGLIDGVLPEPADGAAADPAAMIALFGRSVARTIRELRAIEPDTLVRDRRRRFRAVGTADLAAPARAQEVAG
jgi:acetyl-CoA carboxylase carboxyl transferase subunit beta